MEEFIFDSLEVFLLIGGLIGLLALAYSLGFPRRPLILTLILSGFAIFLLLLLGGLLVPLSPLVLLSPYLVIAILYVAFLRLTGLGRRLGLTRSLIALAALFLLAGTSLALPSILSPPQPDGLGMWFVGFLGMAGWFLAVLVVMVASLAMAWRHLRSRL